MLKHRLTYTDVPYPGLATGNITWETTSERRVHRDVSNKLVASVEYLVEYINSLARFHASSTVKEEMASDLGKNADTTVVTRALFAECTENSSNTRKDVFRCELAKRQSELFLGFDEDYDQGFRLANAENTLKTTLLWVFLFFIVVVIIAVLVWHYGLVVLSKT